MSKPRKPPFERPIDFLIITALEVELDAVLDQFESYEAYFPQDMLRPSYCATVSTDDRQRYRVVATSVFGMGPPEAAIAAAQMAARWAPSTILMVGIAAGMPKKDGNIGYGDVLVAEYIHDYEPAKLTPEGSQLRPRQFPADQALWQRALAYKRTDWRGRIRELRPGRAAGDRVTDVHFGPIASGGKVIADSTVMRALAKQVPKLIGVEMESSGVARAAIQQVNPSRFLAIRAVSDLGDKNKGDRWRKYAACAAAAFTVGFLHYGPLQAVGTEKQCGAESCRTRLLLLESMRRISAGEVFASPGSNGGTRVESVSLDLTDLVVQGDLRDPQTAVDRLTNSNGVLLTALAAPRHANLLFCGHAHIPLAVLTGLLVTDRRSVGLLEYDATPGAERWEWPGDGEDFPMLGRTDFSIGVTQGFGREVILRVAVSYPANSHAARMVVPAAVVEIELSLPKPTRSIVRSERQAHAYAQAVRAALDSLEQLSPPVTRIHLFYAGPMSLAFAIGQQISPTMHPPVTVWNYRAGRYEWGVDLNAAQEGANAIVRAVEQASEGVEE